MHRRTACRMLIGAGALALGACQTTESVDTASDWAASRAASDAALVFGRIRWIENGTERPIDPGLYGWSIAPRLKRLEDRMVYNGKVDKGGHFRWSLPPGTYVIDRINYRDPATGNYFFLPKVAFRVPAPGQVTYVGTLRADAVSERGFLGALSGATKFTVIDDLPRERSYIRAKLGVDPQNVRKSLMVQDDRLPESVDTTAEGQMALTLLSALL